jgi:hypothetical protein
VRACRSTSASGLQHGRSSRVVSNITIETSFVAGGHKLLNINFVVKTNSTCDAFDAFALLLHH